MIDPSREESIFLAAREIHDDYERTAYLEQACAGDSGLRQRLKQLLHFNNQRQGPLDAPPLGLSTISLDSVGVVPGDEIGPYKLREQIGQGGFGVVYVAVQEKPVRRKVALKIIKLGMDTKDVIARFEAEQQALALMDHPNVAKVLDAGTTDSGRPYFVMELVHGVKITEFCDKNRLSMQDRLKLFVDVCRAVQHAHHKGIIHRDLKPSNILVTLHDGKPVPKVIDFGVAKALSQQLTEKSIYTSYGQMIGTPEYMSPEQAEMSGLGVDTRSDIYSLGVLLYELLVGQPPFDARRLRASGFEGILRIIRDEEPPKPSTKFSTAGAEATVVAEQRRTDVTRLQQTLRGELDWIVMKALEKDRTRRFETANSFAADVERYLNNDPVEACPPSTAYRLRKFARRNKGPVTATVALLAMLLLGLAGTSVGLVRARAAAADARLATEEATKRGKAEAMARKEAVAARIAERRLNFRMAFDRGLELCEQGRVGSGMLWLAHALKLAPLEEVAMQRVIRANLTAWRRELHTLQAIYAHKQGADSVAVSPDDSFVLTGALDGAVQLWDRRTGMPQWGAPLRHNAEVHDVVFSPDGAFFLTASIDKSARLWETNSGRMIHEFPQGSAVWGALFTKDGRIITCNSDGEILVWNPDTGKLIDAWENATYGSVHDIALSPDGKQILGACDDGVVLLWDLQSHAVIARFVGHTGRVPTAAFAGPNRIASADTDGNVYLWTWRQGRSPVFGERIDEPWRHRGGVHRVRVSEKFDRLATASYDNRAQLLDCQSWQPIGLPFEHQGGLKSIAFSKDGNILTACEDEGTREWRPAPGSLVRPPTVHDAGTEQALYAPDAKYVLIQKDNTASIRRALTGEHVGMPLIPQGGVHAFAISADESKVMTGADNGKVQLWDAGSGLPVGETFQHSGGAWAVAISQDSAHAVSGGLDGVAKLWDARTGRPIRTLHALRNAPIRGVAFSPDGSLIAIASADKLAWVVGINEGEVPRKLEGHHGSVMTVAFSHDSNRVATGSWDKTVVVWDAETGLAVSKPMRHGGPFWYAVSFSKDGQTVVAGCDDRTARIWDIATAKPIGPLLPHDAALRTAAFTENDSQIITGTSKGTTYNWDVSRSPMEGDVERITLWLQASTGMELSDDGEVRPLDPESWHQRHRRLAEFTPSN